MYNFEPNERVGCLLSSSCEKVYFFGYGHYIGHEKPPADITRWGKPVKDSVAKILLDSGKIIWGCECWYAKENRMKNMIGKSKVVTVDIDEERKKYIRTK